MADDSLSLFPTFEIPTVIPADPAEKQVYRPAPLFDFEKGDFVRDGANRVVMTDGFYAYREWVMKALKTQRGACLSYTGMGADYDGAAAENAHSAVQASLERSITEALLFHPQTARVRDFTFKWNADQLEVGFVVQGRDFPAFDIGLNVLR